MIQVSLVGYAVGGAFLNLAYFDVPYYLLAAVVLTRVLVEKELSGAVERKGWYSARQPAHDVGTGTGTGTGTGRPSAPTTPFAARPPATRAPADRR